MYSDKRMAAFMSGQMAYYYVLSCTNSMYIHTVHGDTAREKIYPKQSSAVF